MTAFADLGPTIETDRLLLRVQRAEDFEHFAELLDDEEACRYIGGTLPRAAAWRKFLQMPGAWAVQGFGMFAVIEKSSGDWLGNIGPWKPVGWPGNEVGWALRRAAWGKGYATEGAAEALRFAFEVLGLAEIVSFTSIHNTRSEAVMQRLGMRRDAATFMHPALPAGHRLAEHCLYRMARPLP